MSEQWSEELFKQLTELQKDNNGVIDINNIDDIIKRFLDTLSPYLKDSQKAEIYHQLDSIQAQFVSIKKDISNISQEVLDKNFVPDINMDLRSVVQQTEKSVTGIIDICDELNHLSRSIVDPKIREDLVIKSTRILEICNFQDITGQRIQKIVHHLSEIESVIYKMLHILKPDARLKNQKSKEFLHGPQKEKEAPSQEDIDALFNNL